MTEAESRSLNVGDRVEFLSLFEDDDITLGSVTKTAHAAFCVTWDDGVKSVFSYSEAGPVMKVKSPL